MKYILLRHALAWKKAQRTLGSKIPRQMPALFYSLRRIYFILAATLWCNTFAVYFGSYNLKFFRLNFTFQMLLSKLPDILSAVYL